ncbi:MAG: hypothetical protein KY457_13780 [Actinobacteria bacterium]|nr:hypothetical protein [Actinomycetota bacterium]
MPSDPAASFAPTTEAARWLVGTEGLQRLADAVAALDAGVDELTVAARLRRDGVEPEHARTVLDAAQARILARSRLPRADELVLTRAAWEQASHPAASTARAARVAGASAVTDLCSGVGGDALAIAATGPAVTAVDRDEARLTLLAHNATVLGLAVTTVVADVLRYPIAPGSLVHADPGRRAAGRRLRRLGELLPPVPSLLAAAAPAAGCGIALSPAVDLTDPDLPADGELEFLQLGPQLVESSLWLGDLRRGGAVATATLLDEDGAVRHRVDRDGPPVDLPVGALGAFLLEPHAAAVRARVHAGLGEELGARRVARTRALLTADVAPATPWFDVWQVDAVLPLRARTVAAWLRTADVGPIEIATHGVDIDPAAWWRRLGRPPRGPEGTRIHLVRLDDGAVCVVGHRAG